MSFTRVLRNQCLRRRKMILAFTILGLLYILYFKMKDFTGPEVVTTACPGPELADVQTNLQSLLEKLKDPNDRQAYAWMRLRIERMWQKWVGAMEKYLARTKLRNRKRKKILVFIGALSRESRRNLAEQQFRGGYLGELLQWSDLVSGLYLLGHEVTVISETAQLRQSGSFFTDHTQQKCGPKDNTSTLIYTDIFGVRHMLRIISEPYSTYSCKLRVLDVFGTDPAWNNRMFAYKHNRTTYWAGLDLNPQQFYTMYPENPDNSFLGFSVDSDVNSGREIEKDNVGLIYGRSPDELRNKEDFLKVFKKAGFELYATLQHSSNGQPEKPDIPSFVQNIGILQADEFKQILLRSKVFIGTGSPIEGPAPMEAIAHGAVYINPKFEDHINLTSRRRVTERFFTSQTPYTETSIGEPYVYTVSIGIIARIKAVAEMLLKGHNFPAKLPFEFTQEGYIQRLNVYLEKQSFCDFEKQMWPPDDSVTFHIGYIGQSCVDVCKSQDLVCEPSHFNKANTLTQFSVNGKLTSCTASRLASDIYFPAIEQTQKYCVLQRNPRIYSCAGSSTKYERLCPCRDFINEQIALCKSCDL